MAEGKSGDHIVVESERVGRSGREGEILEVFNDPSGSHYRVRWEDGHESIFYPSFGNLTIVEKRKTAGA